VRLRTRVTKGPGSRAAGVAMAFKLIEAAQTRWRMVNAPHLVALVRAGALFVNGKLVERPADQDQQGGDQQAASNHANPQVLTILGTGAAGCMLAAHERPTPPYCEAVVRRGWPRSEL
jgi:hypothetical protein